MVNKNNNNNNNKHDEKHQQQQHLQPARHAHHQDLHHMLTHQVAQLEQAIKAIINMIKSIIDNKIKQMEQIDMRGVHHMMLSCQLDLHVD